jgi:hypothetical protein
MALTSAKPADPAASCRSMPGGPGRQAFEQMIKTPSAVEGRCHDGGGATPKSEASARQRGNADAIAGRCCMSGSLPMQPSVKNLRARGCDSDGQKRETRALGQSARAVLIDM